MNGRVAVIAAPDSALAVARPLRRGLACPQCQALAHASRLEELAASARRYEDSHELVAARAPWQAALELLPADSSQAAWVRGKLTELAPDGSQPRRKDSPAWARRLGPLAPLAVLLLKGKVFLWRCEGPLPAEFRDLRRSLLGAVRGQVRCRIRSLILVHELGHFIG